MDSRRFFLALGLSVVVLFAFQTFFPVPKAPASKNADSSAVAGTRAANGSTTAAVTPAVVNASSPSAEPVAKPPVADSTQRASLPAQAENTVVSGTGAKGTNGGARYTMSSIGAAPVSIVLPGYENRAHHGSPIDLSANGQPALKYHLVTNKSAPVDLSTIPFAQSKDRNTVTYNATVGGVGVTIRYAFVPDSFVVRVTGSVTPAQAGYLLVDLPSTFVATESDTNDDRNHLAYAYLSKRDGARNVTFRSLDPGEKELVAGPLTWVAAKSKYFVVGILAPKGGAPFSEVTMVGGARVSKTATRASATTVVPINSANGAFGFDMYTGPQALKRLESMGRDFQNVNPYGWAFLRGVLQPIATAVAKFVLWMHERLALSYGWVLVVLGVLVRLVMWPLNQSAMRSSMKMQVLQPELQAVQTKYKDDPEKQRTEIMKVYAAHGMSPLSPVMGCLPSLLPMPVLFALFFVFQSTIEFRGVHFLWLNDLSTHDPYYILPVLMGVSMYLLQWIGMRNAPPNPQMKMMSYVMPGMFLVLFFRMAAGLNLYYAVQNIAAIPQQWMLAQERLKKKPQPST